MSNKVETTPILGGGAVKEEINEMKRLPLFVTLSLVILPLVFATVFLSVREFDHQTSVALERREEIATLGASLVHEKLDGIINMAVLLASRPLFYQNIEKGKWNEAIKNMENIPQELPFIDAISFFDEEGVLKARIPSSPELIGKSFAQRDYYQGVSKEWKTYVSSAFRSAAEPKHNVVTVTVPIWSSEQKVLGVLLLGIKLETIVGWSNELDVGPSGLVHVLDKKGQLIAHGATKLGDGLVDHSQIATVQKILRGEHGVEVLFDPVENEEVLVAYAPVQDYGYGVEIVQPTRIAFAERNRKTAELAAILTIIAVIIGFFSYRILRDRAMIKAQRDREILFLESLGDGVVAIDRNWNITLWNRSATTISGWQKKEALGKPFRSIVKFLKEPGREEHFTFIEDAIISGNTGTVDRGLILVKKDGSEVEVSNSAAPVVSEGGKSEGAIIVFSDVSKERESDHLRSDFAYAAHQLRTPVTEALWNIEIAQKERDGKKRNESLEVAHDAMLSVKDLEEHIINVSEIDRGIVVPHIVSVKINDVFEDLKKKLLPKANLREVTLTVEVTPATLEANTDPKLLKGALSEIMENAIFYGREGTTVKVQASLRDENIIFETEDHGWGIPDEDQPIIFTKFFRGSNRGTKIAGSGLGLFIAKEYVKILDGKIWFNSEEDKGTTFFISIPAR